MHRRSGVADLQDGKIRSQIIEDSASLLQQETNTRVINDVGLIDSAMAKAVELEPDAMTIDIHPC